MKIAIVGTGYVGLVTGVCFAEMGVDVVCVDVDEKKIGKLCDGISPIYEPGLDELLAKNIAAGRLTFSTVLAEAISDVEVVFSAVGTPPGEDGSADLKYVMQVAEQVGNSMDSYKLIVTKSTVPVGTAKKVKTIIEQRLAERGVDIPFDVASNPEFLKEGNAIQDFLSPDRVVIGIENERAKEIFTKLYRPFLLNNFRVLFMDIPSAEMTKYAANSMLATRISFMNDIANLCELVGADVNMVRRGIGSDTRIGTKFLYPGTGYGGSCFPKDVKALIRTADEYGYDMQVLKAVEGVNNKQKTVLFGKMLKHFGGNIEGRKIAVWGLSFKPETDDIREATSEVMVKMLNRAGASVSVYDPVAMDTFRCMHGDIVRYVDDKYEALDCADALVLLTEWKEFRLPSWDVMKKLMKKPVIFDGRNIYDRKELDSEGIAYYSIGS